MKNAILTAFMGATAFSATPAWAANVYSRVAQVGGSSQGDAGVFIGTNTRYAEATNSSGLNNGIATATTDAGFIFGSVSANVDASPPGEVPNFGSVTAKASGFFLIEKVRVTKLPGYAHLPDTVTAEYHVTFSPGSDVNLVNNLSGGINSQTGFLLADLSPDNRTLSTSNEILVDTNFTLSLTAGMRAEAKGPNNNSQAGSFTVYLGGSPVLVLPEGYVANSADGLIVNSFYTGPVPEPASLSLIIVGGLITMRRRRDCR